MAKKKVKAKSARPAGGKVAKKPVKKTVKAAKKAPAKASKPARPAGGKTSEKEEKLKKKAVTLKSPVAPKAKAVAKFADDDDEDFEMFDGEDVKLDDLNPGLDDEEDDKDSFYSPDDSF